MSKEYKFYVERLKQMNKTEKQLLECPFTFTFEDKYVIEDNEKILLNSIEIYNRNGVNGCNIGNKVNFEIRVIDGKRTIYPLSNDMYFIGHANIIVSGYKLEIKAGDSVKASKNSNDDYAFLFGGENTRDPNRLYKFYDELRDVHINYFPDWRFGQLFINFLSWFSKEKKRDLFFSEEDEMIKYIREYAKDMV